MYILSSWPGLQESNILFLNILLVLLGIVPNSNFTGLNNILYIYIYIYIERERDRQTEKTGTERQIYKSWWDKKEYFIISTLEGYLLRMDRTDFQMIWDCLNQIFNLGICLFWCLYDKSYLSILFKSGVLRLVWLDFKFIWGYNGNCTMGNTNRVVWSLNSCRNVHFLRCIYTVLLYCKINFVVLSCR